MAEEEKVNHTKKTQGHNKVSTSYSEARFISTLFISLSRFISHTRIFTFVEVESRILMKLEMLKRDVTNYG